MAFTYDDSLADDASFIRLQIGDTISGAGPRPHRDNTNFSDATIAALYTRNDDRVNATIATLFETLAQEWARFNEMEREGDVTQDAKQKPDFFLTLAKYWRNKPDGSDLSDEPGGVVTFERTDAWTDDE